MRIELIFPSAIILMNAIAAIIFMATGNPWKAGYFASAASITIFATFGG